MSGNESDASYGKLSQLYLFMGCKESMLKEAAEAVQLIQERNRYKYLLCENHKWKSFEGRTGECYLNLVGDLNTPGQVAPASYYALWPEQAENATGDFKYAPKVMLKIEVAEGARVEKGQTLFTIYGAKYMEQRKIHIEAFYLGRIRLHIVGFRIGDIFFCGSIIGIFLATFGGCLRLGKECGLMMPT